MSALLLLCGVTFGSECIGGGKEGGCPKALGGPYALGAGPKLPAPGGFRSLTEKVCEKDVS